MDKECEIKKTKKGDFEKRKIEGLRVRWILKRQINKGEE
jgi:hypothetical protein